MELTDVISKGVRDEYLCSAENSQLKPAFDALKSVNSQFNTIISQGKLSENSLSPLEVQLLINTLSALDSNNWPNAIPCGEREGRVFSSTVKNRHFGLSHGIGRSGNIKAIQPKARGSSLLLSLTQALACDAMTIAGYKKSCKSTKNALLLPTATGLALSFCFSTLKRRNTCKNTVIWMRIDQGSCYKSMLLNGCNVVVIELKRTISGSLAADLESLKLALEKHHNDIFCIHATSSCFAPREPDNIIEIAKLAKTYQVPLVVNNAYGVQSSKSTGMIEEAWAREDCELSFFVQSLDKNFMVPVGGSMVVGKPDLVKELSTFYPGRASISPMLDLLITLLEMGKGKWQNLLKKRVENFNYLKEQVKEKLHKVNLIDIPKNNIQLCIELPHFDTKQDLGGQLFYRGITGVRLLRPDETRCKFGLSNFGAHTSDATHLPYITLAVTIGMTREDIDSFISKLNKLLGS